MEQNKALPKQEITVDSNWIMTVGMALLFAFCAFLLIWDIRDLLFGKVEHDVSHTIDVVAYALGAVYSFLFAYSFRATPLKVAFLLLGTNYTVRLAIGRLHVSASMQHFASVICSIAWQIALIIILVAIAQWFKSVVRRVTPPNPGARDPQL